MTKFGTYYNWEIFPLLILNAAPDQKKTNTLRFN